MKKTSSENKKFHIDKQKVAFVVFLLAWVALSMTASQYLVAYPMRILLGDAVTKPVWTLVYDILVYALSLTLVIWLPPRLWHQAKLRRADVKVSKKAPSKAGEAATKSLIAPIAKTVKSNTESIAAADNPLTTDKTELGMGEFPTFVDIGLAPIGYIAYMVLANVLTAAMSVFTWFVADQPQDVGFGYFITTGDRIMAMVAIVLIAPIAEEIIMRGWLYGKMRTKVGAVAATLLISVLFGLLHGQWNVAVSTFALSVVLCSLREVTGTIWSGMLLHILSNGIAFYLLYIAI